MRREVGDIVYADVFSIASQYGAIYEAGRFAPIVSAFMPEYLFDAPTDTRPHAVASDHYVCECRITGPLDELGRYPLVAERVVGVVKGREFTPLETS